MSRQDDTTLIKCNDCDWIGMVIDCRHGYEANVSGDVEPVDYCPECGSDQLETLADIRASKIDQAYDRLR